jgi:hypothetical protein
MFMADGINMCGQFIFLDEFFIFISMAAKPCLLMKDPKFYVDLRVEIVLPDPNCPNSQLLVAHEHMSARCHFPHVCALLLYSLCFPRSSFSSAVPCPTRFVLLQGRRRRNIFQETQDLGLRCQCWTKTSLRFVKWSGSAHASWTFSFNRQLQHQYFYALVVDFSGSYPLLDEKVHCYNSL